MILHFFFKQKSLPKDHPDLATSYNSLGNLYQRKGEYDPALENYIESLRIRKKSLPKDHPSLATSYNSLGNQIETFIIIFSLKSF